MSSAPGWRELRWFAVCASLAALFNLANAPITTSVGEPILLLASRLALFFGGLHAAAWVKYAAEHDRRKLSRGEIAWIAGGVAVSVLALVPGLVLESRIVPRPIAYLHVIYADAPPTKFGLFAMAYYEASACLLFVRALMRRRRRSDPEATAHTVALGALVFGGLHDVLASADVLRSPYILDLALLVLVLAVGGTISSRFVASAQALEASSRQLEAAHRELLKKERLAALGELSAVVAHEVRNPLAVVFNATAGLRRTQPGTTDYLALVTIVQEEAERLRDIVSDLLEFARPRPPVLAAAALDEIVRGAVTAACSVAGTGATEAVVEVHDDVGHVTCDERLVRQAVVNLVTNALQTTGRRRPVHIGITEDESRRAVLVRVVDDGSGIADDVRERIFTPFFSTRPKGTGLGLAVVRRCADAHGGDVVVRSTPGGGATFELSLPRRDDCD
ncbi:MAG: Flagellar sensor histidine kinase FleS [Labilithrix sp.]|nr:Flagellar sensor histidine kinase FleS [Labilithrix sp.]